jgi:hypothetical protein
MLPKPTHKDIVRICEQAFKLWIDAVNRNGMQADSLTMEQVRTTRLHLNRAIKKVAWCVVLGRSEEEFTKDELL